MRLSPWENTTLPVRSRGPDPRTARVVGVDRRSVRQRDLDVADRFVWFSPRRSSESLDCAWICDWRRGRRRRLDRAAAPRTPARDGRRTPRTTRTSASSKQHDRETFSIREAFSKGITSRRAPSARRRAGKSIRRRRCAERAARQRRARRPRRLDHDRQRRRDLARSCGERRRIGRARIRRARDDERADRRQQRRAACRATSLSRIAANTSGGFAPGQVSRR